MTDNEKRAHDLAVALLDTAMEAKVHEEGKDTKVTFFETYLRFYNSFLSDCENHFGAQ